MSVRPIKKQRFLYFAFVERAYGQLEIMSETVEMFLACRASGGDIQWPLSHRRRHDWLWSLRCDWEGCVGKTYLADRIAGNGRARPAGKTLEQCD